MLSTSLIFYRDKPVILILGGSLGARTINESILGGIRIIERSRISR